MDQRVSHSQVGEKIGLSYAQVSRLRSGDRLPSIRTMLRIEAVLGWPLSDQARLHQGEKAAYAIEFNKRININESVFV